MPASSVSTATRRRAPPPPSSAPAPDGARPRTSAPAAGQRPSARSTPPRAALVCAQHPSARSGRPRAAAPPRRLRAGVPSRPVHPVVARRGDHRRHGNRTPLHRSQPRRRHRERVRRVRPRRRPRGLEAPGRLARTVLVTPTARQSGYADQIEPIRPGVPLSFVLGVVSPWGRVRKRGRNTAATAETSRHGRSARPGRGTDRGAPVPRSEPFRGRTTEKPGNRSSGFVGYTPRPLYS